MLEQEMEVREFRGEDVAAGRVVAVAPRRVYADPDAPAIADADDLGDLDDRFDPRRPLPVRVEREIDACDADWATHVGLMSMITSREGATFVRLAEDVFIISVYGGQYLHHDRHLAEMPNANGFSESTWNLVVDGNESQQLLLEVAEDVFTTAPLTTGTFCFFNTVNRHAVTRVSPTDTVVIVQVDGFGPDEEAPALARIEEVLRARPDALPV